MRTLRLVLPFSYAHECLLVSSTLNPSFLSGLCALRPSSGGGGADGRGRPEAVLAGTHQAGEHCWSGDLLHAHNEDTGFRGFVASQLTADVNFTL